MLYKNLLKRLARGKERSKKMASEYWSERKPQSSEIPAIIWVWKVENWEKEGRR